MRVPTTPATVIAAAFSTPSPGVVKHVTDVDDVQEAVMQFDTPIRVVGVVTSDPKSMPDTVTLHPVVVAALDSPTKLTTGAVSEGSNLEKEYILCCLPVYRHS